VTFLPLLRIRSMRDLRNPYREIGFLTSMGRVMTPEKAPAVRPGLQAKTPSGG